jgi:hypothetical protein
MCWTTKIYPQELKANRDIDVFKICSISPDNKVFSVYWGKQYKLNTAYVLPIELEVETMELIGEEIQTISYSIHQAFHSYSSSCKKIVENSITIWHSTTFLDSYSLDCVEVLGFIPKGSTYYINEWGEYVSNAICLTKIRRLNVLDK